MTYWGYHLIFTLPLIVALAWLLRGRLKRAHLLACLIVSVIAFVATTPWDNYAVWLGIWGFGDGVSLGYPAQSLAASEDNPGGLTWLGHIPVEEYAFFIIETILVCLLAVFFLPGPANKSGADGC
jgi:lycopene cyclase domain-containing protein